jgi:hypothetical protein
MVVGMTVLLLTAGCGGPTRLADPSPDLTTQVEVLRVADEQPAAALPTVFVALTDEAPIDSTAFVGRIRLSAAASPDAVFEALRRHAEDLGANTFRVRTGTCGADASACTATLDLFAASESVLEANAAARPTNQIYVFGALAADGRPKTVKLNGTKRVIAPRTYVAYQNETGKKATLAVGGFTGAKLTVAGREGRPPSYWSLARLGVGPYRDTPPMAPPGNVGLSFNTGRIYPVPPDAGHFLVRVLDEQPLNGDPVATREN